MKLTIPKSVIQAHRLCIPSHDIRHYLQGLLIHADPQGVTLVSTTGTFMLATRCADHEIDRTESDPESFEVIVPGVSLRTAGFRKSGRDQVLDIEITTEPDRDDPDRPGVTIKGRTDIALTGAVQLQATPIDGTFPNWKRVVPATTSNEPAQVNPRFVGIVGEVADQLLGKGTSPRAFWNGLGPVVYEFDERAFMIVMPLREPSTCWAGPPAWVGLGAKP